MRNIQEFLKALIERKDVKIIEALVDPELEIAEIHRRVIASGGPALLFKNVKGSQFPVLTNMFGSESRVNLAFGNRPKDFVKTVASIPKELLPPSLSKIWKFRGLAKDALKIGIRNRKPYQFWRSSPPVCTHKLKNADLSLLPALKSWPEDGGRFVTLPLVHTPGSEGHPDNLGMYRIHIHDAHETGMHFQIGKGGGFHLHQHESVGKDMPAHLYIGGPPALILSAIAPLPENVPELLFCSLLQGEPLSMAKVDASPLSLVEEAEFALVGKVPAGVRRPEGPFGDHYGYYSWIHDYPVFRPHTIYHRDNAIYPATVVGKPRQEDFYLGDYLQELLLPLISVVMPGVRDLWSYGETGYHALAAAVLKERYQREALSTCFRILGEGQLSLTKFLLACDRPMDLRDFKSVFQYILERFNSRTDLQIFAHTSMDSLDYASSNINLGSKGLLLGVGEAKRKLPTMISSNLPQMIKAAKCFLPGCLVIETCEFKDYARSCEEIKVLLQDPSLLDWPFILLVDSVAQATRSDAAFLWTAFTRFEPARDIHARESKVVLNSIERELPILLDARMKPWYPKELFCDDQTSKKVSDRWNEYFPSKDVIMGDSATANL